MNGFILMPTPLLQSEISTWSSKRKAPEVVQQKAESSDQRSSVKTSDTGHQQAPERDQRRCGASVQLTSSHHFAGESDFGGRELVIP